MNLLLLAIAFRAWSGSALSIFLRVMAAIAALSLEMQCASWLQAGTLPALLLPNLVLASAATAVVLARSTGAGAAIPSSALPPAAAIAALAALVLLLAVRLPVAGADPYHLQRVELITRTGTLAYNPSALDVKVNTIAGVYELLLADLRVPGTPAPLLRLHGVLGLAFYLLGLAAVQRWLPVQRRWLLAVLLVVPVVFHQLVLVKNDLFAAVPAFVALAWMVGRGTSATAGEVGGAAALAGFAVGVKISSAPVAVAVAVLALIDHRANRRAWGSLALGGAGGAIAGGLLFTLVENYRIYGNAVQPYASLGNRHDTVRDAATGLGRFAISLVDLGRVTPRVWPGRGGWGSTFGLPFIWAAVVLMARWRRPEVRRAGLAAGVCFVLFGATYPDADIAHRLMIAPAVLVMAVAVANVGGDERDARVLRGALVPVMALSALQIVRSSMLYLMQQ